MQVTERKNDLPLLVAETIRRQNLLAPGDKVIVALSGGADSVALLAILHDLGYDCIAAHCNFHLRGEESMRDMRHAESICQMLGIDLAVKDFDVTARRQSTRESVEMACRSLRYEWFDTLVTREHARAVAVGHHREDNIETFLLNLMRSTGIDGLTGIRYRRDYIIRPLLDCSRKQIEDYLTSRGLSFVDDSSNFTDDYLRNKLRNSVIPELVKNFPGAENAILSTAANVSSAARIYHRAISEYKQRFISDDGTIDLRTLMAELGQDALTVLREFLKDVGITTAQCADMLASADKSGLRFDGSNGTVAELDRGIIRISRPELVRYKDAYEVDLHRDILVPINLRISRHHIAEFMPQRNKDVIYIDGTALEKPKAWCLRRWRQGDRMRPFGMSGTRLISDLFSDAKYSASDKRKAWLLTCDDEIVWVVGLRASSLYQITPETKTYLKITYKY